MSKGWVLCHECGKANITTCSAAAVFCNRRIIWDKRLSNKRKRGWADRACGKKWCINQNQKAHCWFTLYQIVHTWFHWLHHIFQVLMFFNSIQQMEARQYLAALQRVKTVIWLLSPVVTVLGCLRYLGTITFGGVRSRGCLFPHN